MTLVIAEEEDGRVVMGADSAAGSADEVYVYPHLEKIWRQGPYLLGSCGNLRVAQVLQHQVEWPEPPDGAPLLPFLVREVAPQVRRALMDAGAAQEEPFILGDKTVVLAAVRGELYIFGADLAVVRSRGTSCIGAGRHAAYPTIEALRAAGVGPARQRIERTLAAVAERLLCVEPPFRFLDG